MNSIPHLFMNPTWDTLAKLSTNELTELIVLGLMSIGLIGVAGYGIYTLLFRRHRKD